MDFPIIAISIVGILATSFLLLGYYLFVIKCCLNWHRIDLLRRFAMSQRRDHEDPLMVAAAAIEAARRSGLDESVIRSIPLFRYRKALDSAGFCECAVCLNEFQENENLRRIPNCSHLFHIDCIDIWLQSNANCPLCRTSISTNAWCALSDRIRLVTTPSSTPQDPNPNSDNLIGGDEDYVVIELGHHQNSATISPSPRKFEAKKSKSSKGDECIDIIRGKDEEFGLIQPIRRSFSMDSCCDRPLYLAVQEIISKKNRQLITEQVSIEGCSSSRGRRNLFSFGHCSKGSSRSASILPLYFES